LLEFANLKKELAAQLPAAAVEYYLVSVDPRRDTPERLREYVTYFDPAFHGITGPEDAVAELAQAGDALFFVPEGQEDPDHYLVSHSSNAVLLNPAGAVYAIFTPPRTPAQLATEFAALAAHYDSLR
jgi:protein SCO1/2